MLCTHQPDGHHANPSGDYRCPFDRSDQATGEGRSLVPMLKNPETDWDDNRHLVHHVGAWEQGQAAQSKHARVSIQNKRFTLVNNEELYDLQTDPGETENVIAEHPKSWINCVLSTINGDQGAAEAGERRCLPDTTREVSFAGEMT